MKLWAGYRHTGPAAEQKSQCRLVVVMVLNSSPRTLFGSGIVITFVLRHCSRTTRSGRTLVAGMLPGSLAPADSGPTFSRTVRSREPVWADGARSPPHHVADSTAPPPPN